MTIRELPWKYEKEMVKKSQLPMPDIDEKP